MEGLNMNCRLAFLRNLALLDQMRKKLWKLFEGISEIVPPEPRKIVVTIFMQLLSYIQSGVCDRLLHPQNCSHYVQLVCMHLLNDRIIETYTDFKKLLCWRLLYFSGISMD